MTRPIGWHKRVDSAGEECVSLELWGCVNLYKEAFEVDGMLKCEYATQLRGLLSDMRLGMESAFDEKEIRKVWDAKEVGQVREEGTTQREVEEQRLRDMHRVDEREDPETKKT